MTWHVLYEDIVDLEERMEFLLGLCKEAEKTGIESSQVACTRESFEYFISRLRTRKRWAANYKTRTQIRIDLFFNLAN